MSDWTRCSRCNKMTWHPICEDCHLGGLENPLVTVQLYDLETALKFLFRDTIAELPHWYNRLEEAVKERRKLHEEEYEK